MWITRPLLLAMLLALFVGMAMPYTPIRADVMAGQAMDHSCSDCCDEDTNNCPMAAASCRTMCATGILPSPIANVMWNRMEPAEATPQSHPTGFNIKLELPPPRMS